MRALSILNLGLYLFVSIMLLSLASYHMASSLLDPSMSFASHVPAELKSKPGWQLQYFAINITSLIISMILIVIGLFYFKRGEQSSFWSGAYYIAFLVMIAIATLLIYLLTLEPVIT